MSLKNIKTFAAAALIAGTGLFTTSQIAYSATVVLSDSISCNAGTPTHGVQLNDVTGNLGGASNCWGTYGGNDPGPSGDGFSIAGTLFDFVAKKDAEGDTDGQYIGLTFTPVDGSSQPGTWEFNLGAIDGDFLIVLKHASNPGFAVWLFSGAHADSYSGTWLTAWGGDGVSHISVYETSAVPIPAAGFLLIGSLGSLVALRRRRKAA